MTLGAKTDAGKFACKLARASNEPADHMDLLMSAYATNVVCHRRSVRCGGDRP